MSNKNAVKKPMLFVISGASGTGKTTLCRKLEEELGLFFSVSATTRPRRPGEVEGRDYLFISEEKFHQMIQEDGFLEWAEVHDYHYGTPRSPIELHLARGEDVLLDIDTQGALCLKRMRQDVVLIFLKPPSITVLRKRLEMRGTDSEKVIAKRICRAQQEIARSTDYDYVVLNEEFDKAKAEIKQILLSY